MPSFPDFSQIDSLCAGNERVSECVYVQASTGISSPHNKRATSASIWRCTLHHVLPIHNPTKERRTASQAEGRLFRFSSGLEMNGNRAARASAHGTVEAKFVWRLEVLLLAICSFCLISLIQQNMYLSMSMGVACPDSTLLSLRMRSQKRLVESALAKWKCV